MKKLFTLVLGFILTYNVALAAEQTPAAFVNKLVDDIVADVLTSNDTKEQKAKKFEEYVLNAVDINAIARTVLGQYWRSTPEKERNDFIEAFKEMAIKMTSERFNMYTGQEVKFFAERPAQGKNQYFIDSTVSADPTPIQVVWRVREKDGNYQVLDIVIEGVSMALTYRNEYTTYLQTHTMQELIAELKRQTQNAAQEVKKETKK